MPFAQYIDSNNNVVQAIRWDGTEITAEEVVYQISGISIHTNTIGEATVKELRFGVFLVIPEGDWMLIAVTETSISATRMTDAAFNQAFTLVP
ncbi:MAG: hypothetical protein KBF68_00960 [Nitrosomonas sp.]|jgi:hypothetical protein|nr:hypothetical protein [Nitrosomonas sp.]MBP9099952.1 hypothetical protein [Nitrosomonas sp.]